MTSELTAWARLGIGFGLLVIVCVLRDVIVARRDAASVSEAMRSRR